MSVSERFWERTWVTSGCWSWLGERNEDGYGKLSVGLKKKFAHRVSWEIHKGPIPPGLCVCHGCDNPSCVNPDHLYVGTHKQNMEDKARKGRVSFGDRKKGSQAWNAKLDERSAFAIRYAYVLSGATIASVATKTGMSENAIRCLVKRKTWTHI